MAPASARKLADKGPASAAKNALDRGLAALEAKDLPTAARLLGDAFRQSPRPEILFHLARVAQAEGQALSAIDLFRRYLADPSRDPDEAATRAAEQAVQPPIPASGSLVIQSDPGTIVVVDDRVVGVLPLPLPLLLSPGPHSVVLELGSKTIEAPVQVPASRVSELRASRASGAVLLSVLPAILVASPSAVLPADTQRRIAETLEQVARTEGHTTLSLDLALSQPKERERCLASLDCLRELAQKQQADWLLVQSILPMGEAQNPVWKVQLRLFRRELFEPAAESDLTGAAAKLDQALSSLKQSYSKLLGSGLGRPRGSLNLVIEPAQATVEIDRQRVQVSPSSPAAPSLTPLWVGSHHVVVQAAGHQTQEHRVEVREGETTELRIQLMGSAQAGEAHRQGPPQAAARSRLQLALAGVMVGAGAALLGVGIAGLAMHGSCTEAIVSPAETCPRIRDTRAPGLFSLGSGAALVVSGVVLFVLPSNRRPAHPAGAR